MLAASPCIGQNGFVRAILQPFDSAFGCTLIAQRIAHFEFQRSELYQYKSARARNKHAAAVRALVHRCRSTPRTIAHFPLFVQNELREAADGATIDIEDPATGASIATCATAGPADVAAAVDAAKAAWPAWRDVGAKKRATILRNAAQELRRRVPELCDVETRQTGRPRREYKAQLSRVPEWYEYHASLAETTEGAVPNFIGDKTGLCLVQKRLLGVCGLITPFNHPLLIASSSRPASRRATRSWSSPSSSRRVHHQTGRDPRGEWSAEACQRAARWCGRRDGARPRRGGVARIADRW